MSVLVVGGGLTGLTAAWALGRAGVPTLLVEASDRLGGKVRTERTDGFLVEHGPDSFVAYRPAALELCRELGLGEAIIGVTEPRVVHIRTGGRFVPLPAGMGLVLPTRVAPFVTTPLFSYGQKLRASLDLFLPRLSEAGDVSIGAFLQRRLGRAVVDRLAGPLLGGVYGTGIDELSLDAVVPQLRESERLHRSLMLASLAAGRARAAGARSGGGGPGTSAGSPFVTLAGGTGQLVGALSASIARMADVRVRTGVRVVALERQGGRSIVVLSDGERLRPEAIVLATPAPVTAGILEATAPAASVALRSIPYGSTGVVSLGFHVDQFPEAVVGHGFLVAGDEPLAISAATFSSRKWSGRAPEGMVLIRAFLGSTGESLLAGSDDEVVAAVRRDLAATMGVRGEPALVRVARWVNAMPHYAVGHLDRVAAACSALAGYPDLALAGAAYRGVGMPDCVGQGRAAVEAILSGGGATADWAEGTEGAGEARGAGVEAAVRRGAA